MSSNNNNYLNDYLSILRWRVLNEDKIKKLTKAKKTGLNNKYSDTFNKVDNNTLFNGVELFGEKNNNIYDGSIFKNCPETKQAVLKLLPKREIDLKQGIAKLAALYTKFRFFPHGQALDISCKSKALLAIYKTHTIISRVLKLAQKVGLLVCVNNKYRFGTDKYNYSKQYCLNTHVGKIIQNLCTEYKINPEDKYIKRASKVKNINDNKTLSIEHIKKTYNLTLGKGRSVPGLTEEEALDLLYKQYPQFSDIGKIADYDNEYYIDRPEQQIQWHFNVEFDSRGFNNRRGFRAYSDLCSFKSSEKMLNMGCNDVDVYVYERDVLTPQQKEYREKYIQQYFYEHGITNYVHWDASGSIYQIQYYKKNGDFIPDGIDPYAFMAGIEKFDTKEQRTMYKLHAAMQNNFDSSYKAVCGKYKNVFGVKNPVMLKLDKEHGNIIDSEDGEVLTYSEYLFKHFYKLLYSKMQNNDKNTEIFLDESCIYCLMAHYLRSKGFIVVQVYDSFWIGKKDFNYSNEEIDKYLNGFMKNIMVWYFAKYYNIQLNSIKFIANSYIITHISNIVYPLSTNVGGYTPLVKHQTFNTNNKEQTMNNGNDKNKPSITQEELKDFAEWWFTFTGTKKEIKNKESNNGQ